MLKYGIDNVVNLTGKVITICHPREFWHLLLVG